MRILSLLIALFLHCVLTQLTVPLEVEHTLIWTKVPIYHAKIVAESVKSRIDQDGLWGFTGNEEPPPSPNNVIASIGALSEWGITLDRMVKSKPPTIEEAALIERAGNEVHRYVKTRWSESEWETAWFVNPPVRSHFCQEIFNGLMDLLIISDYKASLDWLTFTSLHDINKCTSVRITAGYRHGVDA